jgi:hypothetical protein
MSILNQFFKNNNKLKAMLSFQDLYIGLSPYEAPAVFSLLQALEFERGIIILTITFIILIREGVGYYDFNIMYNDD